MNNVQLRRSRRLQAREQENSEQRELGFKQGVKESRKPLSRDNNAWTGLEQETGVWLRTY